eukprot:7910403-Alexandrium_andersonii.AAC.1
MTSEHGLRAAHSSGEAASCTSSGSAPGSPCVSRTRARCNPRAFAAARIAPRPARDAALVLEFHPPTTETRLPSSAARSCLAMASSPTPLLESSSNPPAVHQSRRSCLLYTSPSPRD